MTTLKNIIAIAQAKAIEYNQPNFSAAHLLWAVLHEEIGLVDLLQESGQDVFYMRDWAITMIEETSKTTKLKEDPRPDSKVEMLIAAAKGQQHNFINNIEIQETAALLVAICTSNIGFKETDLKSFPLTPSIVIELLGSPETLSNTNKKNKSRKANHPKNKVSTLEKFCTNKTQQARANKIDSIIGRDEELLKMIEILGRRNTPNVILTGEPGVGKTAIIEAFAFEITENNVPDFIKNTQLLELDLGALVAGASYKGEIENRLKKIITEIKQKANIILFIDEIHQILDPRGSLGSGAANFLKPELAKGDIRIIGATTNQEYRKYLEKDAAFVRRFATIKVEEPPVDIAIKMLENIIPKYIKHHGVDVSKDAIPEVITMAKRFYKSQKLPASAIGLLDQTMSAIKVLTSNISKEIRSAKKELEQLKNKKIDNQQLIKDLQWFYQKVSKRISPILWNQVADNFEINIHDSEAFLENINALLNRLDDHAKTKEAIVTKEDIIAITAFNTGIPMGKLQSDEKEKLLDLENILKQRVLGQDHALKTVTETLIDARSGLARIGRPKGAFFFVGSTGTGKTELAKAIAAFLFDDENALIRFDMSEYQSQSDYSKLLGASSGLVGYEEGGILVNKIREKPYSVVLFDELEKAHDKIYDIFLSILSDGRVTDNKGNLGDFSNAIIIFTSNLGAKKITTSFDTANGNPPNQETLKKILASEKEFRAEMIGRLSESVELIPFAPIGKDVAELIFNIHLKKELTKNLEKQGILLELSDSAKEYLVDKGYSKEYGARPIIGVIRNQLRKPISRMIIKGEINTNDKIECSFSKTKGLAFKVFQSIKTIT